MQIGVIPFDRPAIRDGLVVTLTERVRLARRCYATICKQRTLHVSKGREQTDQLVSTLLVERVVPEQ